jgi:DNA-directed RNA polymerase specialized sigma54-like protein
MELAQGQEQRQLQTLAARQLQSLKIMQKPLQELREDLRAELDTNPALEEISDPSADLLPALSGGASADEDAGDTENDRTSDDYTSDIDRYEDALGDAPVSAADAEAAADRHDRLIDSLADRSSFHSRLAAQLDAEALPPALKRAGETIIGSVDPATGRLDLDAEAVAREAGVTPAEAAEALRIVRDFDLSPPRADDAGTVFLVPEVAILKAPGGGYTAELLPSSLPRLRIGKYYRELRDAASTDPETRKYLDGKIRSGEFWIDSLARRNATLLAVAREIARRQAPFFDRGLSHLRPMTLTDMAAILGVHETTVGRAIDNKSALTPQGTCPLRLFFTQGLKKVPTRTSGSPSTSDAADSPEAVSTLAVRNAILQMVRAENPLHPLSDQAIAGRLRSQGMPVARRTVAKYREQLSIPPSHLRK